MGKNASDEDSTHGKALPALSAEDKNQAKTLEANLHAEVDQTAAALHGSHAACPRWKRREN